WLDDYLRRGGAQYADVIGYHFYVAPAEPEAMVAMIRDVQQVLGRHGVTEPVWNTESGWLIPSRQKSVMPRGGQGLYSRIINEEEAAAFVVRACILNWASGVERLYWYAWDNYLMGLVEPDGRTVKPAGRAYEHVQEWMTGARIREGQAGSGARWGCHGTRAGGDGAWGAAGSRGPAAMMRGSSGARTPRASLPRRMRGVSIVCGHSRGRHEPWRRESASLSGRCRCCSNDDDAHPRRAQLLSAGRLGGRALPRRGGPAARPNAQDHP